MPIRNYTTKVPADRSIQEIQNALVSVIIISYILVVTGIVIGYIISKVDSRIIKDEYIYVKPTWCTGSFRETGKETCLYEPYKK